MNKVCQAKNAGKVKKIDGKQSQWNEAIKDTEAELKAVESRASKLRAAIQTFKNNRDMGRSWPGSNSQAPPIATQN